MNKLLPLLLRAPTRSDRSVASHPASGKILILLSTYADCTLIWLLQAFAENIMVCGGGSAASGLGAQIVADMQSVSTPSLQPALCSCPDYMPEHTLKHSSWMGAAILSKVTATIPAFLGSYKGLCLIGLCLCWCIAHILQLGLS